MGLGRFGGGVGVTRWLANQGGNILITDLAPKVDLEDSIDQISDLVSDGRVRLCLGEHRLEDFTSADLVIVNPAVKQPWNNKYLSAAINAGVMVTTEIRLLTEQLNHERVIGVTGSAGKSTTSAMIHHLLSKLDYKVHLGGNIGGSLLPTDSTQEQELQEADWIVLELSSAMLYWLGDSVGFADAKGWSPGTAVITNIAPNHLDWHGTLEHYQQSKLNIHKYQQEGEVLIDGSDVEPVQDIKLSVPGNHNKINAAVALLAVNDTTKIDIVEMQALLEDFRGLPHRLELIAECDGISYFNDSKSTTPEATCLAVDAFEEPAHVHLIAGGSEKGADLLPLAMLADKIGGLYTIGVTGKDIAEQAHADTNSQFCENLHKAVNRAISEMKAGDILLLSPGCASFDQYTNFEERGKAFVEIVNIGISKHRSVPEHC